MYCGDETGSFVGVVGTHTSQFGYGGQDAPAAVIPSYVAEDGTLPSSCHQARWADRGIRRPLRGPETPAATDPDAYLPQGDSIVDWDAYEHLWTGAMDQLRVKDTYKHTTGGTPAATTLRPTAAESSRVTHPLLVATPGRTHSIGATRKAAQAARLKHVEICMETLQCGALFLAPTPMLVAFGHGRPTALVVDVNCDGTIVTPVVDGLLLRNAQRRSGRGEDWMEQVVGRALQDHTGRAVRPRYKVRTTTTVDPNSSTFHAWAMRDVLHEIRTSVQDKTWWLQQNQYAHAVPFAGDATSMDTEPSTTNGEDPAEETPSYTLPDGTRIDLTTPIGRDLTRASELLCTSEPLPFAKASASSSETTETTDNTPAPLHHEHPTISNLPLAPLIHASLSAVADADVRQQLRQATIVPHPLYAARLAADKKKILTSKHVVEQSCAAWIGGSILTSLGSFQQLWLSQTEYEEYGAALAVQRFPE